MSTTAETMPISRTVEPQSFDELAKTVRECYESATPVYPIGGGTSLGFGMPAKQPGIGLSLANLDRVIDYPARDMTITVEAGITMAKLAETLASEQQRLPVDVPQRDSATVGGAVATNSNGPRFFGQGSVRDYVIGISAVDGCGRLFQGGGRVVKNVAGYDFCKLLTGSLGTIGVITQVTLKLKPSPPRLAWVTCRPQDLDDAERLLASMSLYSKTTPVAIELLTGPSWLEPSPPTSEVPAADVGCPLLLVGFEGSDAEVDWQLQAFREELRELGVAATGLIDGDHANAWMERLIEFPASESAPLVLRANVVPSRVAPLMNAALDIDPQASIQCHAGNGAVVIRFTEFPATGLSRTLVGKLYREAAAGHGNVVVLSNPSGTEMTRQVVWGGMDAPVELMDAVKREFDPQNILNPDRFVYQL